MKINRLLEMTTILLNKKTVKASELAQRFGVSTRTIYRDVDVLSASGVPVYSIQGANGGISILEDYTVNRAALSSSEKESVLFALKSMQATRYPEIDAVLEKLGAIFQNTSTDWISVDFSPWGSNPDAHHRFTNIKYAILQNRIIEFNYINSFHEKSCRRIEPLRLIFKSQAWYLWGWCLLKEDYRTFRISRIKNVLVTNDFFDRGRVHIPIRDTGDYDYRRPSVHLVLQFKEETLYRLYDDFDEDMLRQNSDGTYTLEVELPEDEWVYGYLLSFGDKVKVIEPERMRLLIAQRAKKIISLYEP